MRVAAIFFCVVSACFTGLVVATDGAPTVTWYILLTALMTLVPLFTIFVLLRRGRGDGSPRSRAIERAAAAANLVLLAGFCLAFVDQYPHPQEEGFVEFVAVAVVTPILSLAALVLERRRAVPAKAG